MKKSSAPTIHRPFEGLPELLTESFGMISPQKKMPSEQKQMGIEPNMVDEDRLFQSWMADVVPLAHEEIPMAPSREVLFNWQGEETEAEEEALLKRWVEGRGGFVISQTDEYIEGTGYGIHPEVAKRLHGGVYSIQAHIDLHGLCVEEAKEAFEAFLKAAIILGKRAVLVVHGRGLSSAGDPVLKSHVVNWLTRGIWRKWVMAFTSARWCDGGTGATYVLLRNRPVTKKKRRRRSIAFSGAFNPNLGLLSC